MPIMSKAEAMMCRSAPWRLFARRVVLPWVLAREQLAGSVLEVGGGAGAMAETVLRDHPDIELAMVDLDPAMVATAQRRLARFGPRADARVADVTSLPFLDESFDAVVSFIMLHHVGDWRGALAEVVRVLKPGGRLIGYDLTRTRAATGFHWADRSLAAMVSPDELRDGLAAVGFESVTVITRGAGSVMRFRAAKPMT